MNYYVYQLRREDSVLPFYIGKGMGDRLLHHFRASQLKSINIKNGKIKSAIASGVKVLAEKLSEGLTEMDALAEEVRLISSYGRIDKGTGILANMTDGGGSKS